MELTNISYAEVQENETYKEIIRRLELRSGYILNLNYSNEKFYIQRPIYSDGYDDEIIFDNDFYADLDNVLNFIGCSNYQKTVRRRK